MSNTGNRDCGASTRTTNAALDERVRHMHEKNACAGRANLARLLRNAKRRGGYRYLALEVLLGVRPIDPLASVESLLRDPETQSSTHGAASPQKATTFLRLV